MVGFSGYPQSVDEFAQNAAYIHEVSGGRFQFGIGIAHAPSYARWEAKPGKPLGAFIGKIGTDRLRAPEGIVQEDNRRLWMAALHGIHGKLPAIRRLQ